MSPSGASLLLLLVLGAAAPGSAQEPDLDRGIERLVADYIDLYRANRLAEWKQLFLPGFTVASTRDDGSIAVRTLDQFFTAQERGFANHRVMGERLEHVRIDRQGRLASVRADFVFWQDADTSRGRLALQAIAERGVWRFHALMFTYEP